MKKYVILAIFLSIALGYFLYISAQTEYLSVKLIKKHNLSDKKIKRLQLYSDQQISFELSQTTTTTELTTSIEIKHDKQTHKHSIPKNTPGECLEVIRGDNKEIIALHVAFDIEDTKFIIFKKDSNGDFVLDTKKLPKNKKKTIQFLNKEYLIIEGESTRIFCKVKDIN